MNNIMAAHIARSTIDRLQEAHGQTLPMKSYDFMQLTSDLAVNRFDLANRRIRIIPTEVFNFAFDGELNMSGNPIFDIPDVAHPDFRPNVVRLDGCRLSRLPDWVFHRGLQGLHLSDNGIRYIPESLQKVHKITYLDMSGNRLTSIPDWLDGYVAGLNVSNNPIASLTTRISNILSVQHFKATKCSIFDPIETGLGHIVTRLCEEAPYLKTDDIVAIRKSLSHGEIAWDIRDEKSFKLPGCLAVPGIKRLVGCTISELPDMSGMVDIEVVDMWISRQDFIPVSKRLLTLPGSLRVLKLTIYKGNLAGSDTFFRHMKNLADKFRLSVKIACDGYKVSTIECEMKDIGLQLAGPDLYSNMTGDDEWNDL